MADSWTKEQRSRAMSRVKNKNTKPEVQVRSMLHRMGYRFRLHGRDLPGAPDIVLPRHRKAIFVHGCFWHNHDCRRGKRPNSRTDFWNAKLDANVERDRAKREVLEEQGWQVLTVWECELKDPDAVREKLRHFMEDDAPAS
jgi:DNA mismatch endonuclease, patch repair protein